MNEPSYRFSALFRVLFRDKLETAPTSEPHEEEIQELFVAPINSIVGRCCAVAPAGLENVFAPGAGSNLYIRKVCDFFDKECSNVHCLFEHDESGNTRVRDLSSTNGTWISKSKGSDTSSPPREWTRLKPGRSYIIQSGDRIKLGERSQYNYEFLGLSEAAFIRFRACAVCCEKASLLESWEWIAIEAQDSPWSTRRVLDGQGQTFHGPAHFEVRTERDRLGGLRAQITYEDTERHPKLTDWQTGGRKGYGAEYHIEEPVQNGEIYQIYYELLLPGMDPSKTVPAPPQPLRHDLLRGRVEKDLQGKLCKLTFKHQLVGISTPDEYTTVLVFHQPPQSQASGYSLRHAIVKSLVDQRLLDQGRPQDDAGWVTSDEIREILNKPSLKESDFKNNLQKWRSDISNALESNANGFQASKTLGVCIHDETDWKDFVETDVVHEKHRIRLHPSINLEVVS